MHYLAIIINLFKPYNRWHIVAYGIVLSLFIYDQLTLPPSKTIEDYKRIEGTLTRLYKDARGGRIYAGQESLKLRHISKDGPIPRSWLNKKVVAYYWPKHVLTLDNKSVFITLPSEEEANLRSFIYKDGFNRPKINDANGMLIGLLLWVVLFPALLKLGRTYKPHKSEQNFHSTKKRNIK